MSDIVLTPKQEEIVQAFFEGNKLWVMSVGGKGSAKTTATLFILLRLMFDKQFEKSKILVARESLRDLKNTLIDEFIRLCSEKGIKLGIDYDENKQLQRILSFVNNSEIFYLSLSDKNEQYKTVRSYEFNVVIVDELDRISYRAFIEASERLRYPHKFIRGLVNLNPVPETHWIYKEFVEDTGDFTPFTTVIRSSVYDNFVYVKVSKDFPEHADRYTYEDKVYHVVNNRRYEIVSDDGDKVLTKRYNPPHTYLTQMEHKPYYYRRVMLLGEWGNAFYEGNGLYTSYFTEDNIYHDFNINSSLAFYYNFYAGIDFGVRRPAYVLLLEDELGRLVVIDELIGDNEPVSTFIHNVAKRMKSYFGITIHDVEWWGDIAGRQRDQFDGLSILKRVQDEFKISIKTMRNPQFHSVEAIRDMLTTEIQDQKLLRVYQNCHITLNGFLGEFQVDDNGKLLKDGYYEHIHDALRYVCFPLYKRLKHSKFMIKTPKY
jgi:PBSX family phage terminase large subunit